MTSQGCIGFFVSVVLFALPVHAVEEALIPPSRPMTLSVPAIHLPLTQSLRPLERPAAIE